MQFLGDIMPAIKSFVFYL